MCLKIEFILHTGTVTVRNKKVYDMQMYSNSHCFQLSVVKMTGQSHRK